MKSYRQASKGQQLTGIVSYLNEAQQRLQAQPVSSRPTVVNISDLASLVEAYKLRAAKYEYISDTSDLRRLLECVGSVTGCAVLWW